MQGTDAGNGVRHLLLRSTSNHGSQGEEGIGRCLAACSEMLVFCASYRNLRYEGVKICPAFVVTGLEYKDGDLMRELGASWNKNMKGWTLPESSRSKVHKH